MTISITINNILRTFEVHNDYSLSWAVNQVQPSTIQIPLTHAIQSSLWVLLNESSTLDANKTSIFIVNNARIVTIQYALKVDYFDNLLQYNKQYGIRITLDNVALLIFSLHAWLQQPSPFDITHAVFLLVKHYPHYFTQPKSIIKVYYHAKKNIDVLQELFSQFLQEHHGWKR